MHAGTDERTQANAMALPLLQGGPTDDATTVGRYLGQGSYGHSHDDGEVLHAVGESCCVCTHDPLACAVRAYATTLLLARRFHPPFDSRHTNPLLIGTPGRHGEV